MNGSKDLESSCVRCSATWRLESWKLVSCFASSRALLIFSHLSVFHYYYFIFIYPREEIAASAYMIKTLEAVQRDVKNWNRRLDDVRPTLVNNSCIFNENITINENDERKEELPTRERDDAPLSLKSSQFRISAPDQNSFNFLGHSQANLRINESY